MEGTPNGDEDEAPTPVEVVSVQDQFLKLNKREQWELGLLPELGTHLHIDLADAMHAYVTQKWGE